MNYRDVLTKRKEIDIKLEEYLFLVKKQNLIQNSIDFISKLEQIDIFTPTTNNMEVIRKLKGVQRFDLE